MSSHVTVDRWQFTLTVMFHYLFPILTMGLALFIAWLETVAFFGREGRRLRLFRKSEEERAAYHHAAHFWAKIFAVNFAVGVVTGIPLEFQFGTNWAGFSNFAGGVIGQTLAMEGVFAFFAESVFIGIYVWRRSAGPRLHWTPRRTRSAPGGSSSASMTGRSSRPEPAPASTTTQGPMNGLRASSLAPRPSGMKCRGASTWVPVWAPSSRRDTLAGSPRSIAFASSIATPGSPA